MRIGIKKAGAFGVVWLFLITLFFVSVPAQVQVLATDDSAENTSAFEAELSVAREEFFSNAVDETASLETIYVDSSRIIHVPQEYIVPEPPSRALQLPEYAGPFIVGDTRPFRATIGTTASSAKIVTGKLVGQGEHSNIWVLDDADYHAQTGTVHDVKCHLNDITPILAQNIANDFDAIYELVTTNFGAHSEVLINVGFDNLPFVGDLGEDSKVNFLMYDLYGDGGGSGGYTAGFFAPGDFLTFSTATPILRPPSWGDTNLSHSYTNGLDMLHIDIGHNQGFNGFGATANIDDKLNSYGTLAHELQHLLFYMYFSINYADVSDPSVSASYNWINEALSELAGTYCVQEGAEIADFGRLSYAAQNNYASGDFLNFYSSKSYGMGKLFSMLMYKSYGSPYSQGIYDSIISTYPPAKNNYDQQVNKSKIVSEGHDITVGRFLKAGTGVGDGVDTLPLLYYLFMENFAADGGMIYNTSGAPAAQATKFYSGLNPVDNLWAVRPVLGISNGAVFVSTLGYGSYYSLATFSSIPTYASGTAITLTGYGTTPAKGASHEMLYKLSGGGSSAPILTITAPNDLANTRYYAVIPKDSLSSGSPVYTSGVSGADIYPLSKGVAANINTNGQETYLFVTTLYQNVTSSSVTYTWTAAVNELVGKITLTPNAPKFGNTVTTSITPSGGAYTYKWYSDGTLIIGASSDTYTPVEEDIGKVIRVEVTETSHSGSITAQTAPVAKTTGPSAPPAPTLFSRSDTGITLVEVAGCEYSRDGLIWQSSPVFSNLLSDTLYDFYQRIKATATAEASAKSLVFEISTLPFGHVEKPGDINDDGQVDATDLSILISDFGKTDSFTNPGSDINKDGKVDATDLSILIANFGT